MTSIPNLLTLLRILLAPVLVLFLKEEFYATALLIFIIAGVTDGLDGYIAKRFDMATDLGAILDSVADKILIVSTYVMLAILEEIPFWLLLVVAFRDLLLIGGYIILSSVHENFQVRPSKLSKLNTCLQISLVVVILIQLSGILEVGPLIDPLIISTLATTVISGIHYLLIWSLSNKSPDIYT